MNTPIEIRIYENQRMAYSGVFSGRVELGRQKPAEPVPFFVTQGIEEAKRLIIARIEEAHVSCRHVHIEALAANRVRVRNVSATLDVVLRDGELLRPGAALDLDLPAVFSVGLKTIRVSPDTSEEHGLYRLSEATLAPGSSTRLTAPLTPVRLLASTDAEPIVRWLQTTIEVLESAASSADFFEQAAGALVDQIGLDAGQVLLRKDDDWTVAAIRLSPSEDSHLPHRASRSVLQRVLEDKTTYWQVPAEQLDESKSLAEIQAVVAAPILDRQGQVIGALYGDRRQNLRLASAPNITKLEAMLVETLAFGVAAGLARMEQEKAALAAQTQFEQFFTPELSRQLPGSRTCWPDVMPRCRFCSATSAASAASASDWDRRGRWNGSATSMGVLSDCVLAPRGVLVDYIGDELMAMWGAPEEQPDHANRACRAALDHAWTSFPALNERWQAELGEPMDVGIGINTGMARVGNTGSQPCKFKYGPLGNTVNLASRVQGATKYLKSRLLITGRTQAKLDGSFPLPAGAGARS